MVRQAFEKSVLILSVCLAVFICAIPGNLLAQELNYKVEQGDTLWSICEKYYGNPDVWPKLWEMNPFITNPHLLKPGDVVKLMDREEMKKAILVSDVRKKEAMAMYGLDVSNLTRCESIGFFSRQ